MMTVMQAIPVAVWLFAATTQTAPPAANALLLSTGRAGTIKSGVTVDQLITTVGRRNTKPVDRNLEGAFSPWLRIRLPAGTGTLDAEIRGYPCEEFRIDRLLVKDPRFKTARAIGVGST